MEIARDRREYKRERRGGNREKFVLSVFVLKDIGNGMGLEGCTHIYT